MYCICRSPSWGAWIEIPVIPPSPKDLSVAPPRGERGLKFSFGAALPPLARRSPSWGAWIEIVCVGVYGCVINCRSPSWGAWIEISYEPLILRRANVAPPRGERGLKSTAAARKASRKSRSPSWGAWIEMYALSDNSPGYVMSLPLVGSVD